MYTHINFNICYFILNLKYCLKDLNLGWKRDVGHKWIEETWYVGKGEIK